MTKYEVEITIRKYRFGNDIHCEIFNTLKECEEYLECVKRDQPHLINWSIQKINL